MHSIICWVLVLAVTSLDSLKVGRMMAKTPACTGIMSLGMMARTPLRLCAAADVEAQEDVGSNKFVAVFNPVALNISASNPFGTKATSREDAKRELQTIIASRESACASTSAEFDRFRLDYLVKYLESTHVPIQTAPFLSLAIGGEWVCRYTNALLPHSDHTIRWKIFQEIMPASNHTAGIVSNRIQWSLDRKNDPGRGELCVQSTYTLSPKGALTLSLVEHVLDIEELPLDSAEVISTLQRTVPFQFFDPNRTTVHHTFIAPDIRISRISGPVVVNMYEIHERVSPLIEGVEKGKRRRAV